MTSLAALRRTLKLVVLRTLIKFLRPYASHYGNREAAVLGQAAEPLLEGGGLMARRCTIWAQWAGQTSTLVAIGIDAGGPNHVSESR